MNLRNAVAAVLIATLSFGPQITIAQVKQKIQLSHLQSLFSDIRAKTPWNIDGPMLWGYFFVDTEASRLLQIASELAPLGYKLVSTEKVQGKMSFRIRLEKAETHTPETLNERNGEFYALTEKYGVATYDGMDVKPLPK
jgi:hypothetical protein